MAHAGRGVLTGGGIICSPACFVPDVKDMGDLIKEYLPQILVRFNGSIIMVMLGGRPGKDSLILAGFIFQT